MDTKDLDSFRAVYECGSFAKAAERMYITPQGMSKIITGLEAELGHALFVRTNRGVSPTPYACSLYSKAEQISKLLDSITGEESEGTLRTLHVACVSGSILYLGPSFEQDFAERFPDIRLEMLEGTDEHACSEVGAGTADCGFVAGPVDYARFEASLLARHPHVLVVPKEHPLAQRAQVTVGDLQDEAVCIMGPGFSPHSYIQDRFARENVSPRQVIGCAEISTAFRCTERGQALTITTDFAALPNPPAGTKVIPFAEQDFSWDVFFITRRGEHPSDEARELRDFARTWYLSHEREIFPWRKRS